MPADPSAAVIGAEISDVSAAAIAAVVIDDYVNYCCILRRRRIVHCPMGEEESHNGGEDG